MDKMGEMLTPARVLVLGFLLLIIIGTILLTLPVSTYRGISVLDALFTATSAVCVTGLVVKDTGTFFTPFGQTVILFLIQVGGLGFMTAGTLIFIILGKKITLKERLVIQEALNQLTIAGLIRLIKKIILFTFIIEGIGAVFLSFRFVPLWGWKKGIYYSIFHAISAFCNAGFDLMGNFQSLTNFSDDYLVRGVIMSLFIIGGLGFTVLAEFQVKKRFKLLSLHSKIVISATLFLLLLGTITICILEYTNSHTLEGLGFFQRVSNSLFTSATARTAGFNTIPTDMLQDSTLYFILALMFVGASPASTGGGIKTTTFSIIIIAVISIIKGQEDVFIYKRRLPFYILNKALSIVVISVILVFLVSISLTITEVFSFMEILFEAVSAFGTVGLSTGITPDLSPLGRALVIFTMFSGRVGPLTLTLALAQRLKKKAPFRYPEERILVG
ncbi:MAG: Trk family potassium uptake protein [Candidatus Syntrophonatronum acetioxidans]|uniref:Trk family potassium uptake protein n=1 Tax=Candidatus Syntrophonatronum acetioxidans TaxID=1795816 RepID=A0A424YGV5_9FIRM|nr:MAG: Trk family potassium uptake protein [Candidatus Syntrophonatronum acetioxidans]